MTDKVEDIMKRIHTLFAKSEEYNGSPDKIIISRKEMFDILEELNMAIYDVLDQYEATTRSKEKARLEMERMAMGIIADAKREAEDVNAASLLYTDTMLEELKVILETSSKAVNAQIEELRETVNERLEMITENKEEVREKLSELNDKEFYLNCLQDKRKKDKEKLDNLLKDISDLSGDDEDEDEEQEEIIKHAEYVIKINDAYKNKIPDAKKAQEVPDYTTPHANPDDYDLDSEYYQWKEEQGATEETQEEKQKKPKRFIFGKKR